MQTRCGLSVVTKRLTQMRLSQQAGEPTGHGSLRGVHGAAHAPLSSATHRCLLHFGAGAGADYTRARGAQRKA